MRALAERGLVNYAPYDLITLTAEGLRAARDITRRHEVLRDFFIEVLSVNPLCRAPAAVCTSHIGKAVCQVPWFSYHHASYAGNVSPA